MQVHVIITGRVQGVGFRQFVKSKAKKLQLTGFVQNLLDGSVEVIAQGPKDRLEMLLQSINQGTPVSEVKEANVLWQESSDTYPDFSIHHLS